MPPPFDLLPELLRGLAITLQLTAGGTALAFVASLVAGFSRLYGPGPVRLLAVAYIELFRGTSALVQLFWFYYVLPLFGVELGAMLVGILVLGLNVGAYGAEVVRGAVQAVPAGQIEAAVALNFSPAQRLLRIVFPQAAVAMIPPMGNLTIELLKDSALVSLVAVGDLTFAARTLRDDTLRTTEIFGLLLLIYFAVAACVSSAARALERRLAAGVAPGASR